MNRMKWILLVLLLLLVVAAAVAAVRVLRRSAHAQSFELNASQRRCLKCRGTGWVGGEPERTFNFDGAGFEDRHTPKKRCPDCGGTGSAG
jgi:DnaJ-class molecular chaperone